MHEKKNNQARIRRITLTEDQIRLRVIQNSTFLPKTQMAKSEWTRQHIGGYIFSDPDKE